RALTRVKERNWLVGGGGRGLRYNLNPDQSWKEAIGSNIGPFGHRSTPYRGVAPSGTELMDPKSVRGTELAPSWYRVGTEPIENCKNPDTTAIAPAIGETEAPKTGTDPLSKASELVEKVGVKPPDRRKADVQ